MSGTATDMAYYRTFAPCAEALDEVSGEISGLIKEVCGFAQPVHGSGITLSDDLLDPVVYETMIEVIDSLLESADLKLDQVHGKAPAKTDMKRLYNLVDKERILRANTLDIPKPQDQFSDIIDNSRESLFRPRIVSKPNFKVPLERSIGFAGHIFDSELQALQYDARTILDYLPADPLIPPPPPPGVQPFEFVDSESALSALVSELKSGGHREIAVDLENHSYRSFQGFSCLMQVRELPCCIALPALSFLRLFY
jgi:hypothetical protein